MPPKKLRVLSKAQILSAEDLGRELVEVPEWGGAVYVQAMSGLGRDAYESSILEINEDSKGRIRLTRAPKPKQSDEWQRANKLYRAQLGATPLAATQREVIHRHLVSECGAKSATELSAHDLRTMAQDIRSLGARDLLDILRSYEEVTA